MHLLIAHYTDVKVLLLVPESQESDWKWRAGHSAYHQLILHKQFGSFCTRERGLQPDHMNLHGLEMGIRILTARDGFLQLIPGPEWDMYLVYREIIRLICFCKETMFILGVLDFWMQVSASLSIFLVFFVKCSHRHSYIWQKESFWKWKNLLSDKLEKRNEAKYMLLAKRMLMPVVHLLTLLLLMIFWMVVVHLTS